MCNQGTSKNVSESLKTYFKRFPVTTKKIGKKLRKFSEHVKKSGRAEQTLTFNKTGTISIKI